MAFYVKSNTDFTTRVKPGRERVNTERSVIIAPAEKRNTQTHFALKVMRVRLFFFLLMLAVLRDNTKSME